MDGQANNILFQFSSRPCVPLKNLRMQISIGVLIGRWIYPRHIHQTLPHVCATYDEAWPILMHYVHVVCILIVDRMPCKQQSVYIKLDTIVANQRCITKWIVMWHEPYILSYIYGRCAYIYIYIYTYIYTYIYILWANNSSSFFWHGGLYIYIHTPGAMA